MSAPLVDAGRPQVGRSQCNEVFGANDHLAAPHLHALRVIEGEHKAHEFLARLRAGQADPDEFALIIMTLQGAVLHGFCALIIKALRGGVA